MEKNTARGAQIRLERRRREWSQKKLAELVGCSESLVQKIEKGTRDNEAYIVAIEKILGI